MKSHIDWGWTRRPLLAALCVVSVAALTGCSSWSIWPFSSDNGPKPTPLSANPAQVQVRQNWSVKIGEVRFPLLPGVAGQVAALASSDGTVMVLDSGSGRELWRIKLNESITAGVGTDGQLAAVVTASNEVVAIQSGAVVWKHKLSARAYTAPLVAGERVFVMSSDRMVTALDGKTGARLWVANRQQTEPLVIQQSGVLVAVGNTLVAGHPGRLVGLNPDNGSTVWDSAIAFSRGGNDVERLVDIVAPVSRRGDVLCARAYFSTVGCVDARQGQVMWSSVSRGATGAGGDDQAVYVSEHDGRVQAMRRTNGNKLWSSEAFLYRGMNAPAADGRHVVAGDAQGYVHWLSRDSGAVLGRTQLDSSPVLGQQYLRYGQLLAWTRSGTVTSLSAE